MASCVNCGKVSDSQFCPDCGQNLNAKPISFKVISFEMTDKWLGFDTKFGRTLRDLTIRPHRLIEQYLNRNTVKYVGPLGYFVIVTALMLLVFDLFNVNVQELILKSNESFGIDPVAEGNKQKEMQDKLMGMISSNFRIMAGLIVPFTALGLMLTFRKSRNYLENLVASLYLHAHTIWITVFSVLLLAISGYEPPKVLEILIGVGYFIWGIGRLNTEKFKLTYLRAFAGWIIGFLIFILSLGLFSAIYIMVFYS